jgi:hypothetical protein
MKCEESGRRGLCVYYLVPGTPLPLLRMESRGWREFFGVVFETKEVISKVLRNKESRISCAKSGLFGPVEADGVRSVFKER